MQTQATYLSNMNGQQELNAALHNVVRPSENYYEDILQYMRKSWNAWRNHGKLTSEEIALLFETSCEKTPAEPRVYGAVIKQLQKEGKIRHVGYTKATNKQAHCRPISVWEVV